MIFDLLNQLANYSLRDFLLFSPEVYWRLVSNYLHAHQFIAADFVIATAIVLYLLVKQRYPRLVLCFAALLWLWLGWQFYFVHYQTINHYAHNIGYLCFLQGLLTLGVSIRLSFRLDSRFQTNLTHNNNPNAIVINASVISLRQISLAPIVGVSIAIVMMALPAIALLAALPWSAGVAGMTPIPTVMLTLLVISQIASRWRFVLYPLPILIGIIELLTLYLLIE